MSFGMQGLHVLRHAESGSTRPARQARGEFWGRIPSRGYKILGFQDWKYWMIGKTARIGGLEARDLTRRGDGELYILFIYFSTLGWFLDRLLALFWELKLLDDGGNP